jgi:hypothetical protein
MLFDIGILYSCSILTHEHTTQLSSWCHLLLSLCTTQKNRGLHTTVDSPSVQTIGLNFCRRRLCYFLPRIVRKTQICKCSSFPVGITAVHLISDLSFVTRFYRTFLIRLTDFTIMNKVMCHKFLIIFLASEDEGYQCS